jgi:uncharacterized membrane protein YfcA
MDAAWLPFSETQLLIITAVFFGAALAKGVTGLGFSTACLPFLVLTLGLRETLPLLLLPSLSSNVLVMRQAGHFQETVRRFWPMFLAQIPGIFVGLWLLIWLDSGLAAAILGCVLIVYCMFAFAKPNFHLRSKIAQVLRVPCGFLTGSVNGLTGSQVIPVMPYLLSLQLSPPQMVQAINASFTLSSVMMVIGLTGIGLMTLPIAVVSLLGLIPVYLGIKCGSRLRDKLAPELFRKLVLATLIALGVILVLRLVFAA